MEESIVQALGQGVTPGIIVVVYLLIVRIIDAKKESASVKLSNNLLNSIKHIDEFITSITKNIVDKDKDKCQNAIKDGLSAAKSTLITFVASTIVNNHIDTNRDNIITNINNISNAVYYDVFTTLSNYVFNGDKASDFMKIKWIDEISADMMDCIYAKNITKEEKIIAFTTKIGYRFDTYKTYLINHAI